MKNWRNNSPEDRCQNRICRSLLPAPRTKSEGAQGQNRRPFTAEVCSRRCKRAGDERSEMSQIRTKFSFPPIAARVPSALTAISGVSNQSYGENQKIEHIEWKGERANNSEGSNNIKRMFVCIPLKALKQKVPFLK